jgi:hypothetical protein
MEYIISDPKFLACGNFAFEEAETSIVSSFIGRGQVEVEVSMQEDMILIATECFSSSSEFHSISIMDVDSGPRVAWEKELNCHGIRGISIAE